MRLTIHSSGFILLLSLTLLATIQAASGQAVETRAEKQESPSSQESSGSGAPRTLYSHKHLSPHRMMHFGKRPLVEAPPSILFPTQSIGVRDLKMPARAALISLPYYQTSDGQQLEQQQPPFVVPKYQQQPALISYNPMKQIFEDSSASSFPSAALAAAVTKQLPHASNKQLVDVVTNLIEYTKQQELQHKKQKECATRDQATRNGQQIEQQQQQQQISQTGPIKMMKLLEAEEDETQFDGIAQDVEHQQMQQEDKRSGGEQAPQEAIGQQDQSAINVASRSVPIVRSDNDLPTLTRAHLSSLLYGRHINEQPAGLVGLGNYIKKAEPQKMSFMHFG